MNSQYFKTLEGMWHYYFSCLPIEPHKYNIYYKIIDKIKNNNLDFTEEDKDNILKLINLLTHECDYNEIKILEIIDKQIKNEMVQVKNVLDKKNSKN